MEGVVAGYLDSTIVAGESAEEDGNGAPLSVLTDEAEVTLQTLQTLQSREWCL